jgi:hypothetical protein
MASEVGICNAALQLIKNSKQITSLEQGTKEANACEVVFSEMRDACLEVHNWNFATKRQKLPQLTDTPAFEWDFSYQLPSDFIRVSSVHNNSSGRDRIPYKIENGVINSDASDIYLRYVARVEDPNLMPATFRLALSKILASRLAVTLSGSASLSKEMYEQYTGEDLPTAKSADSIQDMADQLPESDWVNVRSGQTHYYEPGEIA